MLEQNYRTAQSSKAHRTEPVSVMGHELATRVRSTGSLAVFGRISLFWSVALQGHHVQRNGRDHDWLIQTPVFNTSQPNISIICCRVP